MKAKFAKKLALLLALVMICSCFSTLLLACEEEDACVSHVDSDGDNICDVCQAELNSENNGEINVPTGDAEYIMYFYTASNDSGASQIEYIKAKAGTAITKPENPSYPGYNFGGWYTDYGVWANEYTNFNTMPAQNLVLYAKWEEVSSEEKEAYENGLNANSVEGHLYIHYKRFNNTADEYEKYNLWVWPKAYTGVEFDWVRDSSGEIIVDELGGATCDVDLTAVYDEAGNNKDVTTTFLTSAGNYATGDIFDKEKYMDDYVGFLIVDEASKVSALANGGHWVSDGGNQFIPKASDSSSVFADKLRENGSLHIFATQEHVYDYAYSLADVGEMTNPYEDDDGTNVSIFNVNSSGASSYGVAETAGGSANFDVVKGVGYQIMVASFADSNGDGYGDIKGITNNLDYLESLNVDVLWLTPIQLSDSYHGYDIIDYKEVDPKFGTLNDYKELLEETEKRGMTVIMDLVLNHTSINNVWFQKSSQLDPEYRSFYQWRNNNNIPTGSKAWHQFSDKQYSYYGKFATSMPELNYDYQPTRDAIVDVAKYWLNLGVDGFRIDAVKHIYMEDEVTKGANDTIISDYDTATQTDYSSNVTKNIHFFKEFNARVKEEYPNAYIVGENFDGNAYNVAPYYQGLDSMLNFYAYYNFAQILDFKAGSPQMYSGINAGTAADKPNGSNTSGLYTDSWSYAGTLSTYSRYRQDTQAIDTLFTSNHDVPRLINNVVGGDTSANWFGKNVTSQNSAVAIKRAKAVMATMMSLPGISFIYYGDELGMTGNFGAGETKTSPHVDRQYRQPFKWEKGATAQTTSYSISGDVTYYVEWDSYNANLDGVKEQASDNNSMLSYTKKWTNLKHNDDVIKYGKYSTLESQAAIFAYKLTYNGTTYYCYHNFSEYDVYNYKRGGNTVVLADSGVNDNTIPAYSSVIYK